MKRLFKKLIAPALIVAVVGASTGAHAQRSSTMGEKSPQDREPKVMDRQGGVVAPKPPPAPATVKAKYEGGIIGFGKSDGTLNFDDANSRLLFRDKAGKEMFSVPYSVINATYADTQSRRPMGATIAASAIPFGLGLPALFIKKKYRYLTVHYLDPDSRAEGLASFKMDNTQLLASVVYTLADKAGLTQRGEAFVRRREPTSVRQVSDAPRP